MTQSKSVQPARILVVDDDHSVRMLVSSVLAQAGYDLSVASSVDEAIQLCIEHKFDMVLTDVMMPGKWGTDLARPLVQHHTVEHVILMTAFPDHPIVSVSHSC